MKKLKMKAPSGPRSRNAKRYYLLDFINSQDHTDDQLDQVLQSYQIVSYHLEKSITFHVAQASQASHGSLVDRGDNGGLAGSDVRAHLPGNVLSLV